MPSKEGAMTLRRRKFLQLAAGAAALSVVIQRTFHKFHSAIGAWPGAAGTSP